MHSSIAKDVCSHQGNYFGKNGHTGKFKFSTGGLSLSFVFREQKIAVLPNLQYLPPKWDCVGALNSPYRTTTVIWRSGRRIYYFIITLKYLRRHVRQRATKRSTSLSLILFVTYVTSEAEVCDNRQVVLRKKNVFKFEVSVSHSWKENIQDSGLELNPKTMILYCFSRGGTPYKGL